MSTIEIKNVSKSYGKNKALDDVSLILKENCIYGLLGRNGAGKSTLLNIVSNRTFADSGEVTVDGEPQADNDSAVGKIHMMSEQLLYNPALKVKEMFKTASFFYPEYDMDYAMKLCTEYGLDIKKTGSRLFEGRLAMVPQNPQALFTEITVEEELLEALYYSKEADSEKVKAASDMMEQMELSHLAKAHPYDLSGGEQQRLALGKILLLKPRILILDEPTKGLDPFFKRTLAQIFKGLVERGVTIFMVSHDIEFCAEYADRCAMFFDGDIVSEGEPQAFFSGNSFYTTVSNRMARGWFPKAVTWEEALQCVRDSM